jgi:trehalose/maltose hydrolase-like predicted phosphorylase
VNERLAAIPCPGVVEIRAGNEVFGAKTSDLNDYSQRLSYRDGTVTTHANWRARSAAAEVTITCAPLRGRPHVVMTQVQVRNTGSVSIGIAAPNPLFAPPLTYEGGVGFRDSSSVNLATGRAGSIELAIASTDRLRGTPHIKQPIPGEEQVAPGASGDFERLDAVATSLDGRSPLNIARSTLTDAADARSEALPREQAAVWGKLWQADIEIDGDPEAQAVVRACRFWLLESMRPELDRGVPPMGLSSSAFDGHVFWDMESWMLPAMLPQSPELARSMLAYRGRTLPGAEANAKADGARGAAFAWESADTGRETAPDPFRRGRHIDGDIAMAIRDTWIATADQGWLRSSGWPVLRATADYWISRAQRDSGGQAHIRGVTTPDESAGAIDDSAWTLWGAKQNLEFATRTAQLLRQPANPAWAKTAAALQLPKDRRGLILEYAGYPGEKTKQADTLLLLHPGGMPASEQEQAQLYDYYASRVIRNGPAMTDAIHSLIAARLGRGQEALDRFHSCFRPFGRPPFGLFSEKRTRDNLCFLTGAAGVLQAVIYGFAGLALRDSPTPTAHPHLPPGWRSITLHHVRWRGKLYDLRADETGAYWTALKD